MERGKSQKFLIVALSAVAVWLALRLSLNWALGQAVLNAFRTGTGCSVSLASPRLELFPVRARVENVLIRHPAEADGEGFSAKRVEIGLEVLPLFRKELKLTGLTLEGAKVSSFGAESGFMKTLDFLFPPSEPHTLPAQGANGGFLKSFVVHVTDITIPPLGSGEPQLTIGSRTSFVSFKNVSLRFVEPGGDPSKPFDVTAAATSGSAATKGFSPSWGSIHVAAKLGGGKLADIAADVRGAAQDESLVRAGGQILFTGGGVLEIDGRGTLAGESLKSVFPASSAGHPASMTVTFGVRGPIDAPELRGELAVEAGPELLPMLAEQCKPKTLAASYSLTLDQARFDDIQAPGLLSNGSILFSRGGDAVDARFPIALEKASVLRECAPVLRRSPGEGASVFENTTGQLSVKGTFEPRDLAASLELSLPSLEKARLRLTALLRGSSLAIELDERTSKDPRLTAAASYDLETASYSVAKLSADDFPLENALRVASLFLPKERSDRLGSYITQRTTVDAQASLRGNIREGEIAGTGNLVVRRLFVAGVEVPELSIPFESSAEAFTVSLKQAELGSGSIRATAALRRSDRSLSGSAELTNIDAVAIARPGRSSPAAARIRTARAELSGTPSDPRVSFDAVLGEASGNSGYSVQGSLTPQQLSAKLRDVSGSAEVDLNVVLSPPGKQQVKLSGAFRAFSLDPLITARAKDVHGALSGTFDYDAPLDRPLAGRGSADFPELSLSSKSAVIKQDAPLRLRLDGGRLEFSHVVLEVGEKPFSVSGSVSEDRGWMVDVGGRWDLSALPHPSDAIEQLTGTLDLGVQVRGSLADPEISGTVKVSDGGFAVTAGQDILGFRKASLAGSFDSRLFTVQSFEAITGSGTVKGSGTISEPFSPERTNTDLQISLRRLQFQPADDLRLDVSGNLHFLQFPGALPVVTGKIHVDRATYERTIDLFEILQQLTSYISGAQRRRAAPLQPQERESSVNLDVHVVAENDLIVETNIVRAELASDLQIKGSSSSPLVDGNFSVLEGEFGSESNRFTVNSGKAVFLSSKGSLDPDLSLVAETAVTTGTGQEQQVRMFLTGTLTKPKVEFVSEGGLSQEEIISLLGLRTNLQTVRLIRGDRERRSFVDLLNPGSGATFEDRLSGITGFSEVQVDTAISGATGEVVPRLVARRPIAGRLSLDAVSELSGQQLSILNLSYPLTVFLNAISGFRTIPPSGSQTNGSGSFYIGLRHRSSFPGTSLLPRGLTQNQANERTSVENNIGLQRK